MGAMNFTKYIMDAADVVVVVPRMNIVADIVVAVVSEAIVAEKAVIADAEDSEATVVEERVGIEDVEEAASMEPVDVAKGLLSRLNHGPYGAMF